MSTVTSLRLPKRELDIFRNYAKINNMSLSEMIRNTVMERIEDEYLPPLFPEIRVDPV